MQSKLQGADKVYSGKIRLGVLTDTGDITGKVVSESPVPPFTLAELQTCLDAHLGAVVLPAPAYSAVKHKGKPLYKYARKGIEVPVKPRSSTLYSWAALGYQAPDLEHRMSCSSGTYVRSLAEAAGKKLGCGAAVLTLRRESIASFSVEGALTLEGLKSMDRKGLIDRLAGSLAALLPAS